MLIAGLDTETTGFCEPEHRIVEAYIDLYSAADRRKLWTMNQRINPLRNIPADATRVHHITNSDVADKPTWETIGPLVHKALNKAQLLVIHNAEFDYNFLNMEFARIGLPKLTMPALCTMESGIWATSNGKKPSLAELCFACDVDYNPSLAHAADYDVGVMMECFWRGLSWGFFMLPEGASLNQVAA